MLKKILSVILTVSMLAGLMGTAVFANDADLIISDAAGLKAFADAVNVGTTYDNQYVKLTADIDLKGEDWAPIGNATNKFLGTFDGGNFTISNLNVNIDTNNAGLFGFASVVKNLKINNAQVSGIVSVGSIAGELESTYGTIDNCHVTGTIQITGENSVGGLAGKGYANIKNSSVDGNNVETSYVSGVNNGHEEGDNVGGIIGHNGEGHGLGTTNCTVKNIKISGTRKIGGIVGTTNRVNDHIGNTVENVTVECTATADYAADKAETATIGGIVGNYFGSSTSGGVLTDNTVNNLTLVKGNAFGAGALVGGDRQNNGGAPVGVDANDNTTANVTGATNNYLLVASIGGTTYSSIEAAIEAASEGAEITLISDVNVSSAIVIAKDKNVILNLNGKTISAAPTVAEGFSIIINKGTLTINDETNSGKIVLNHDLEGSTSYAVNTITNSGSLTINGGTISNNSTAQLQIGYAIDNNSTTGNAIVVVNGGIVSATGSLYYDGIRQFCNSETLENSVTIQGGEVSSLWMQNPSDGATVKNTKNVKGSFSVTGGKVTNWIQVEPSTLFSASVSGGEIAEISYFDTKTESDIERKLTGFVTGGKIASLPEEVVADGYEYDSVTGDVTKVAKLPEAEVSVMDPIILTPDEHDYMVWPSGDASIVRPLEIVMNFKAKDTLKEAQQSPYGKWKTDFYLTLTGLTNGTVTADNCYLAGNYGTFGWIVIPTDGLELEEGVCYPVVSGYDANLTYEDICGSVKDFTAAIHIDEAILTANPNFKIKLELKMTNPNDESDVLVIGEPAIYDAEDLLPKAEWTCGTDAGAYKIDGTTYGMMRYLFNVKFNNAFTETGIKYFKASDLTAEVASSSSSGDKKSFYGDIINIPSDTDTNARYYAKAYVKIGDGEDAKWFWSEAISCSPSFKKVFTNYTPNNGEVTE